MQLITDSMMLLIGFMQTVVMQCTWWRYAQSGMQKHTDMYNCSPGKSPLEMVLADSWYVSCNLSKALAAPVWSSSVGKNCLCMVRLEMNPTKENKEKRGLNLRIKRFLTHIETFKQIMQLLLAVGCMTKIIYHCNSTLIFSFEVNKIFLAEIQDIKFIKSDSKDIYNVIKCYFK